MSTPPLLVQLRDVDSMALARANNVDPDYFLETTDAAPHSVLRQPYWQYRIVEPSQPAPV
jgi:hypothetical protein